MLPDLETQLSSFGAQSLTTAFRGSVSATRQLSPVNDSAHIYRGPCLLLSLRTDRSDTQNLL